MYLNSSGFDPSLFHDDDGRKYLVNQLWDHRPGRNRFAGIVLQEYSPAQRKLIGERQNIFKGTAIGFTEAPHLYKRNGYYYLITAEGGTGWGHAMTMARSRSLTGPYELHPDKYIVTARDRPHAPLHRAGHGDLVETQAGDTYAVYLCGRPLPNRGRCVLGRETAIQKMVWGKDDWLRTLDGSGLPELETPAPALPAAPFAAAPIREDFDGEQLPIDFQWLRSPWPEELFSLSARPGYLRLYGRETIGSVFRQSLVARRQQAHCYSAITAMEFEPAHFQQAAGLVCYYNSAKFHYLHVSHDEEHGRHVRVMSCVPDLPQSDFFTAPIPDSCRAASNCAWKWITSACASRTGLATRPGTGCRNCSTPAHCPMSARDRARPTSPVRSWAWPARTCRARRIRRISISSSTGSGNTSASVATDAG